MSNIDVTQLYFNFLNYCWNKVSTHNKDSIKLLSDKIDNTTKPLYNENNCDFLQESKVRAKIEEIITNSQSLLKSKPVSELTYTEQIEFIKSEVIGLKLLEYVKESPLSIRILDDIQKILGKVKNDLKFADLYSYFNFLNLRYFNDLLIKWIDKFIVTDTSYNTKIRDDITKYIRKMSFSHQIDNENRIYSLSFLFLKNYIVLENNGSQLYDKGEGESDFESNTVIYWPSIKIFCTNENNDEDLFNRFTYFHEIGHFVTIGGNKINIMNDNVCIGTLESSGCEALPFNYTLVDKLEILNLDLVGKIRRCGNLKSIHSLVSSISGKNSTVFGDIFADLFAFSIIVDEMESNGKSMDQILNYVKNICKKLGGDENHFNGQLRFILNIYFNDKLRAHYETILATLPNDPYVEHESYYEKGLKLLNKMRNLLTDEADKEKFTEIIDATEPYKNILEGMLVNESTDYPTKYKKFMDYYLTLDDVELIAIKDKIYSFFDTAHTYFTIDDIDYRKKYLKYKNKYLALKNKH